VPERLVAATVLLRTADRLRRLGGKPVVVKLGGSAMEEPEATASVLASVAALQAIGVRVAVVHGGGKPIDRAMADAGLTPRKVQGIRVTDPETLAIVVRVLHEINSGLRQQLARLGGRVGGFIGEAEIWPIRGDRLMLPGLDLQPIDIGHVGQVTQVDSVVADHLAMGSVPILPSLAVGPDGGWLNVNADSVAAAIGGAIGADTVYFLTDTPGVLADRANPESRIARLSESDARSLIATGAIAGGMIPKVQACFDVLAAGIGRAVILDGRDPAALLADFACDPPTGTAIYR
jgi:acetylglutamate kinase